MEIGKNIIVYFIILNVTLYYYNKHIVIIESRDNRFKEKPMKIISATY